jgi:hypothetical protein
MSCWGGALEAQLGRWVLLHLVDRDEEIFQHWTQLEGDRMNRKHGRVYLVDCPNEQVGPHLA